MWFICCVKPGFYYFLGGNHYPLHHRSKLELPPGQFANQVVLAQVEELWSWYRKLDEIWFDAKQGLLPRAIAADCMRDALH
jgi:hypothetical protein